VRDKHATFSKQIPSVTQRARIKSKRLLSGAHSHRADRIRIERKAVQEASEKGVWNSHATNVLRAFGAASKGSDTFPMLP
jgi:hypothetical protein